ncbi:MAG: deoxyribodipyrimidine photo-lyase [Bacteroidota bacterium]
MERKEVSIFWFRRDLRIEDNSGLYHALKQGANVIPLFIFDSLILDKLENRKDKRVKFIHTTVLNLKNQLEELGSSLLIKHGKPLDVFINLLNDYEIIGVYTNRDYEPYAMERDNSVKSFLESKLISFSTFKDQVIFESFEVTKGDLTPYTIFTPYSKKWKSKLTDFYLKPYPVEKYVCNLYKTSPFSYPELNEIGFDSVEDNTGPPVIDYAVISNYSVQRDYPAMRGTSRLSVHLRFGTVSIRKLAAIALKLNETWLNELIWRDFYMCIMFHFPYSMNGAFKTQYNKIEWRNNPVEFEAWCLGQTGYPIVDAGMRELNETGFMHNRVRMIVASFLTKHLLIDWRLGEAYFAEKLLDFDLAANNGGWQWAAGTGCDSAPYFRVFNPYEQTKKFDKDLKYIRKWVPEFEEFTYPRPIVEHKFARERVLNVYKSALQNQ